MVSSFVRSFKQRLPSPTLSLFREVDCYKTALLLCYRLIERRWAGCVVCMAVIRLHSLVVVVTADEKRPSKCLA